MLNALWFTRRPRGVEHEKRVLRAHPNRLTGHGLTFDQVMHPDIATGLKCNRAARAPINDHMPDLLAAAEGKRLIDRRFERNRFPTAILSVGRDHEGGAHVDDPFLQ